MSTNRDATRFIPSSIISFGYPSEASLFWVGDVARRLREIFDSVATDNGWTIIALAVEPGHIYLFVEATVREAPYQIVHAFKGRSSRLLRKEFPHLLKIPSLWTRAYLAASSGHVSQHIIERYIREQTGEDE